MAKILSIIAPEGFQDKEYGDSKAALEKAGHKVITASTTPVAYGKFGSKVKTDVILSDINPDDYDVIMFIGGPGCFEYFDDPTALKLARDFYNSGKLTTAICAAPSILANAGVLKGKKATCWEGESDTLISKGADYTGKDVEIDGKVITGDGPMSATKFGKTIAENLKD
jgi:protease I